MKPDMRARYSILVAIMLVVMLALRYFDPSLETYVGMQVQTVGGKPYLMLAEQESFGLYAPADATLTRWNPVYDNRGGAVYGTFEIPPAAKTIQPEKPPAEPGVQAPLTEPKMSERGIEGLGVFFSSSCVVFDVTKPDKNSGVISFPMALGWPPEASARIQGSIFAFGAKLKSATEEGVLPDGFLKAARFDGKGWTEVADATGPLIHSGKNGFWLKAVELDGRAAILWRGAKVDQALGYGVTDGDLGLCFFDGTKFTPEPVAVTGLPKGNMSIWADNGRIKCLVQTRQKTGDAPATNGRMEIWNIAPDGKADLAETIALPPNTTHTMGLFSPIAAERFNWENRDYVLRSNWQKFELWRRNDAGSWELSSSGTAGLPVFSLERKLYWALAVCAAIVLLGAWMGFMRRRHALTLMKKLRPRDLYAPLAARASAYVMDMLIVIAAAFGASKIIYDQYIDIFPLPLSPLAVPSPLFAACFLVYYAGTEWLFLATPGKLLMGLRVVADGGSRPTLWASLVRNIVGLLERQPMMLLVSAPMVVFSPRRQRLGDLLSRTFVVQKRGLDMFMAQKAAAAASGEQAETLEDVAAGNRKKDERAK